MLLVRIPSIHGKNKKAKPPKKESEKQRVVELF